MRDDPSADETALPYPAVIVGLGGAAGSFEALEQFLNTLGSNAALTFVLIVHSDAETETQLSGLLARSSALPVETIRDGQRVEGGRLYLAPPDVRLSIEQGTFRVGPVLPKRDPHPIDHFFASLAEDRGPNAVGVLLSGSGQDGTRGLAALRAARGLTIVQDPISARFGSMPQSAVASGAVDLVLRAEAIASPLVKHAQRLIAARETGALRRDETDPELVEQICALLKVRAEQDFAHYKRNTLVRRIQRRMQIRSIASLAHYVGLLRDEPAEIQLLIKDLLIGVTQFFRDPEAFEVLALAVLPKLLATGRSEPIRIWVAGCASGEEAYTLAILLRERMEQEGRALAVQIFATDMDEEALQIARQAVFSPSIETQLGPDRLAKYFTKHKDGYQAVRELREMCIFSMHDLIRDPPFSRIDLLTCRNVLIYFEASVQKKLLPVLHYALRPDGFLFLGPSEHVAGHSELFLPIDKKQRIFQRRLASLPRAMEFPLSPSQALLGRTGRLLDLTQAPNRQSAGELFQRALLQDFSPGAALISDKGEILHVSGRTSQVLELAHGPFENNIFNMAKRELRLELRTAVHKSVRSGETVVVDGLHVEDETHPLELRITVRPVTPSEADPGLFMVVFDLRSSTTPPGVLREIPRVSEAAFVQELESELRRTREDLQATIEELETSNEELKSSNEELLSMNEELQSANEELQTSKEELQSVNEELQTVNSELNDNIDALNRTNDDLENLFQSTNIATLFLDQQLRIKRYTPATAELFRLIDTDVGRPITDISAPFPDARWLEDAREVLGTLLPRERELRVPETRAWYMLRVLPYRTRAQQSDGVVVTFVNVTELMRLEHRALELASIVATSRDAIIGRSLDGTIRSFNGAAEVLYGFTAGEALGRPFSILVPAERRAEVATQEAAARAGEAGPIETLRLRKQGQPIDVSSSTSLIKDEDGRTVGYSTIDRDISARITTERENHELTQKLRRTVEELRTLFDVAPIGLAVAQDPECRKIVGNQACAEILGTPIGSNLSGVGPDAAALPFRVYLEGREVPAEQLPMPRASRGEEIRHVLYEHRLQDGVVRQIEVSAVALFDEHGQPRGAVSALTDVTQALKIAAELKTAARHKDEFLALLGHELRNPLSAMTTATGLLKRRLPKEASRPLEIVIRQLNHVAHLVDDLLDLARISRGKVQLDRRNLDFGALARAVTEDHRALAEYHGVTLRLEAHPAPLWVRGDRVRLAQILGNVLSNALKYTAAGGQVRVVVGSSEHAAEVRVIDNGAGISAPLLERIFEPFEQGPRLLDRAQGGLGLGLSLSRSLVELQGGTLTAASAGPDRGATFTVRLPILTSFEPSEDDAPPSRRPKGPLRILVVEDSEDIAEALCDVLRDEGHEVRVALDGARAIETARAFRPMVVLCDIGLPGDLDGYGVAVQLRQDPPPELVRLVALTGYAREEDARRAIAAGFDVHLKKPVDLAVLDELLAEAEDQLPAREPQNRAPG